MSTCPDWCTNGSDEHPCDGSHLRLEHEDARVASGSGFPIIDERGAIFPAISTGLTATPSEGLGTHLFLWMTGPGSGDGVEVAFTLEEGFGLAVDILSTYAMAIQEIDHPSRPRDHEALAPIVDLIDHNLRWHKPRQSGIRHRCEFEGQLEATEAECDVVIGQVADLVMEYGDGGVVASMKAVPDAPSDSSKA